MKNRWYYLYVMKRVKMSRKIWVMVCIWTNRDLFISVCTWRITLKYTQILVFINDAYQNPWMRHIVLWTERICQQVIWIYKDGVLRCVNLDNMRPLFPVCVTAYICVQQGYDTDMLNSLHVINVSPGTCTGINNNK